MKSQIYFSLGLEQHGHGGDTIFKNVFLEKKPNPRLRNKSVTKKYLFVYSISIVPVSTNDWVACKFNNHTINIIQVKINRIV